MTRQSTTKMRRMSATLYVTLGLATFAAYGQQMPAEYDQAMKTLGKQGDFKDNVLKINIPRNDLKITIDGIATPTAFGFGGWLAMTKGDKGMDVMMGDLVLLEDEVNPVMSALLDNGLEVTALHNHFFWEQPRIFYMHVHGHGGAVELARKARPALDLIGHVAKPSGEASGVQPKSTVEVVEGKLNTKRLDEIIGRKGDLNG